MRIFDHKRGRAALCLWLAALLCLLTACGGGTPNGPTVDSSPETAAGAFPVTFTDALGRAVTLEESPRRVAALLGSFADVWCLAGGEVCAAPEDAWEDFGLELPGAVHIGGAHSPSVELLLSADPDLVLASASTAAHVALLDTLTALGIPVAYFEVDSFEDYLGMLEVCTRVTGRADLYEANGLRLKAEIDGLREAYAAADIPPSERRVLLLRASSTTVKAKGSEGTVLGEMLAHMGCVNIADRDGSLLESLSVEAVIREEPHHIFVVTMGSDTDRAVESLNTLLSENPAWGTLGAVREGRLHVMDKTLYNLKPNDRFGEAYENLYDILTSP